MKNKREEELQKACELIGEDMMNKTKQMSKDFADEFHRLKLKGLIKDFK